METKKISMMNKDYTFENFKINESNKFAANVAIAVSKNPGKAYNPVLIAGSQGSGKTHLLHAIGNYIHKNSNKKVIYTDTANFLYEYIEAICDGKIFEFKNKFRYTDVFLLDEIQFLTNKPAIQTELYYTINALLEAKKQIVFTCDRNLSNLEGISEDLNSYFRYELNVEL